MAEVVKVVNLWSGPRCCSTSLMYAFAQRPDCRVCDEPLYPHYLAAHPLQARPYRAQLLAAGDTDGTAVLRRFLAIRTAGVCSHGCSEQPVQAASAARVHVTPCCSTRVMFVKEMAKFLYEGIDSAVRDATLTHCPSVLLVRHPRAVLASFGGALQRTATLEDTGLVEQLRIVDDHLRLTGKLPSIILNEELLSQPETILRRLCDDLGIPFYPAMLSWPVGGRPEDGMWAPYWYTSTHKSTGFGRAAAGDSVPSLAPVCDTVLQECMSYYNRLIGMKA